MVFIDGLKVISDVGVSVALSAATIYIIVEYFRMKKKQNEMQYNKFTSMMRPDVVEHLVSAEVWSHSRSKLQMIRSILIANHLKGREDEIKLKVQNLLERQSLIYIDWFNTLNTPIPKLGDWYRDNFDFDEFFSEVMTIIFRDSKKNIPTNWKGEKKEYLRLLLISEQIEDISNVMIKFQGKANSRLTKELKDM